MGNMAKLFSFLCLFTLVSIPSFSSAPASHVLDTDGNPVLADVSYYAIPPAGTSTGGGGLDLQSPVHLICPFDVVQVRNPASTGLPLFFSPVNPNDRVVNTETDLNVAFNASTNCVISTVWMLAEVTDQKPPLSFVTIGGVVGYPGPETQNTWFQIRRFEDAYSFYFCPTVCDTCRPICGNLGVIARGGRWLLGISSQPLKVAFKKA